MFVYGPPLLIIGQPLEVVLAVSTALLGVIGLAVAGEGWMLGRTALWERGLSLVAALLLIKPGWKTDLIGLAIMSAVVLSQMRRYGWGIKPTAEPVLE
jgi:TRAP-type uncharacterized transport system fused permease subunit